MNINKKNAIITFDYEVFLGRQTGTIENCVIKPTKSILEILKDNNAKAIFFVDATWLMFLEENAYDDFLLVKEQLKEIRGAGSSIELHLHPQWLDAKSKVDGFSFGSIEHYKLHLLNDDAIMDLFKRSIELIESITKQKVSCFRAGGWCIEPFDKIRNAFEHTGIKYDFSVVPGLCLKEGKVYDFDFSDAPKSLFYNFHKSTIKSEPDGCFVEVPLSTYQNNLGYRIINKILLKLKKDKIFGDGIGTKEKSTYKTFCQALRFSRGMLTFDKTSFLIFKYLLRIHFKKSPLLVIVSHPKTASPQALRNLLYLTKKCSTLNSSDLDKCLFSL